MPSYSLITSLLLTTCSWFATRINKAVITKQNWYKDFTDSFSFSFFFVKVQRRFLVRLPDFFIRIIDKDGVHDVSIPSKSWERKKCIQHQSASVNSVCFNFVVFSSQDFKLWIESMLFSESCSCGNFRWISFFLYRSVVTIKKSNTWMLLLQV